MSHLTQHTFFSALAPLLKTKEGFYSISNLLIINKPKSTLTNHETAQGLSNNKVTKLNWLFAFNDLLFESLYLRSSKVVDLTFPKWQSCWQNIGISSGKTSFTLRWCKNMLKKAFETISFSVGSLLTYNHISIKSGVEGKCVNERSGSKEYPYIYT